MIIATVRLADDLVAPDPILHRPATAMVETLRLLPPLGADLWLWCGMATPHQDRHLDGRHLPTLSVQSRHGIGDVLTDEPETDFPRGALAVIDPRTVHWLVPRETDLADDAGRITLPLWVGLQFEIPFAGAWESVRTLVISLGGSWGPVLDERYADWAPPAR